jgi:LysM repeat protein
MGMMRYLLLIVCLFLLKFGFGQESNVSTEIREFAGKKYYVHTVDSGNTVYGISKLYNVELEEIFKANPAASEGIGIGQELLIPMKKASVKKTLKNELKIDGSFIIHKVVAKETLYGISKQYNILQEQLLKDNPEIRSGMQPGMELRITTLKKREVDVEVEKVETVFLPAKLDSFILHEVKPKQTLYSLAKEYGLNLDSIKFVNGGLIKGLQVGQTIRIPKLRPDYLRLKYPFKEDSSVIARRQRDSNEVRITLFLPFFLDQNDTSYSVKEEEGLIFRNEIFPRSRVAFEFYEGIRLAVDSLRGIGRNVLLQVYDTKSNNLDSLLDTISLAETDIIVGPLYRSNFDRVSPIAKKYGIPIISPVPLPNKILLDNPVVIKLSPSVASEVRYLRDFYKEKKDFANCLVLNSGKFNDINLVNIFTQDADTAVVFDSTKLLSLYEVDTAKFIPLLDSHKVNYIFVPSADLSFASDLVNRLVVLTENFTISLMAPGKWLDYDNLDLAYLNQLNVHYATSYFVDYDKAEVKTFLTRYRDHYGTDPSKYGFLGYELMLNLARFENQNLLEQLDQIKAKGLVIKYDFRSFDFNNGFENQGMHLVKVKDFTYKKVR